MASPATCLAATTLTEAGDGVFTCEFAGSDHTPMIFISWKSASNKSALLASNRIVGGVRADSPDDARLFPRSVLLRSGERKSVRVQLTTADAFLPSFAHAYIWFLIQGSDDHLFICTTLGPVQIDREGASGIWSDVLTGIDRIGAENLSQDCLRVRLQMIMMLNTSKRMDAASSVPNNTTAQNRLAAARNAAVLLAAARTHNCLQ